VTRCGTLVLTGIVVALTAPGATPAIAADTTLVESQSGITATATVGDTITVNLPAAYRPVVATGTAMGAVSASGGYPTGQPLTAVYRAVAPGTADLLTMTDYPCLHAVPPCTVPQRQWIVHVVVVPAVRTVTVTEADSGSSVSLHVGDTLAVDLGRDYRPTKVTGPALVRQQSSGGYPTGQPLQDRYAAAQAGSVDVATLTDYRCLHTRPHCTVPQRQWSLHVIVAS